MLSNKRAYQGGSTATFIIVAIVLLIGFVGAVYYAKQRGELARQETVQVSSENNTTEENTEVANSTDNPFNQGETTQNSTSANESANSGQVASQLPQGGAGDLFGGMLAVFAVAASVSTYWRSVKELKSTL